MAFINQKESQPLVFDFSQPCTVSETTRKGQALPVCFALVSAFWIVMLHKTQMKQNRIE